ncbi:hypothetical protein jhhlp_006768 [Lomentospora prolificans]|uniref:Histone-lysine N-methyltransferase n=1 Tax=Lomentospora prolificans TaxID=41688 RepID=A0A2N3N2Q3_9PEZI|nr:hypothetical protein jhhlp_006768 [Lomentospora prolificans]
MPRPAKKPTMEDAMRRHFFHHGSHDASLNEEKMNCHMCQIRSFSSHADYPITVINDVDNAPLPPDFRFIDGVVLGDGVEPAEDSFRSGCECRKDELCQFGGCQCLGDVGEEDSQEEGSARQNRRLQVYAYQTRGQRAGMLNARMLRPECRAPIYECHEGCACSEDCPNRVVERGRRVPLQIFKTENRGWGVRCPQDLQKGQFVDCYFGEVITAKEAEERRRRSDIAQKKDVYLFALDKFNDPNSLDPRLAQPALLVDGEFMSGPTRFINHSCEPNLRIFARVGDHADKHLHDLALFAIADIQRNTELTFDYIDGVEEDEEDLTDPEKLKEMTKCLCGSDKCRGFLW